MSKWLISISISVLLAASGSNTLAAGDVEAGKAKSVTCMACHGMDGNSPNPIWPKIAGQYPSYTKKQLLELKEAKLRSNDLMAAMVAALSEEDMDDLAAFFSSQTQTDGIADAALVTAGEKIYRAGIPEKGVSACMACHGPDGMGIEAAKFPRIAGQHAPYMAQTMADFRSGTRNNDLNGMMRDLVARMTDEDIAAVASYVQGLR